MAKKTKHEFNYFDELDKLSCLSVRAAKQLDDLINNYTDVAEKASRIHDTEHAADELLHTIVFELSRSFITPLDREDIMQIANNLDDIIDQIEDTSNMLDMFSIGIIPENARKVVKMIVEACDALEKAVLEFKNFKKSGKKLSELIVEVNRYEEEGDRFYRQTIKELYVSEKNPIELAKWKDIYDTMEGTLDSCEDVANLLEMMSIKNS